MIHEVTNILAMLFQTGSISALDDSQKHEYFTTATLQPFTFSAFLPSHFV